MAATRKRVLLVDDSIELIRLARAALEPWDFDVLQETNPFAAVRSARAERPDVIVLDLNMPDMDGLEVLRHLKRIHETRDIPVIAFTGECLTTTDLARCRAFDRIVLKGSGVEALEEAVVSLIEAPVG
jgi:CheY-like chemotaxis protein